MSEPRLIILNPVDLATEWLRPRLSQGPQPSAHLRAEATADGINARTLLRAAQRLRIISRRTGFPSTSTWELPAHDYI